MEPKPPTHTTTSTAREPLSCGQLATKLGRSRYGVKKAIQRLGIQPSTVMSGISYYPAAAEKLLEDAMRQPNLHPASL